MPETWVDTDGVTWVESTLGSWIKSEEGEVSQTAQTPIEVPAQMSQKSIGLWKRERKRLRQALRAAQEAVDEIDSRSNSLYDCYYEYFNKSDPEDKRRLEQAKADLAAFESSATSKEMNEILSKTLPTDGFLPSASIGVHSAIERERRLAAEAALSSELQLHATMDSEIASIRREASGLSGAYNA